MTNRRAVITAVTLSVLVALLLVGAYLGWRALSAPVPERPDPVAEPTGPRCVEVIKKGDVVRAKQVKVSVFNAGNLSGLAGRTQERLTVRGFLPGKVGNAPDRYEGVRFVRVLGPRKNDPAAMLVARQFGAKTKVLVSRRNLGPGVDVVIGDEFPGVVKAPRKLVAKVAGSGC